MSFQRMTKTGSDYGINSKKSYSPIGFFTPEDIKTVLDFAYTMAYTEEGQHRRMRSGGQHQRKPGEIFCDTFQGKLAEVGVKNYLDQNGIICSGVNFETWGLGRWDSTDLEIDNIKINIKSSKFFANLLLLETKDWDVRGIYLPNIDTGSGEYDYFIFVRIKPSIERILKNLELYYSETAEKAKIEEAVNKQKWSFDIPGYITREDLIFIIKERYIIPQNSTLNRTTTMDAANYYIQAGDFRNTIELILHLKTTIN